MHYKKISIEECKGVYPPREDSLLLAKIVEEYASGKVLDLGTGTGLQGIIAAKKGCKVTFADIDANALKCASANAKTNGVSGEFTKTDLFSNIKDSFDTIIFNPPYLDSKNLSQHKSRNYALDGGVGGREMINAFLKAYNTFLEEDGTVLLVESGFNLYERDVKESGAVVIAKEHYFFEDLVVLLLKARPGG